MLHIMNFSPVFCCVLLGENILISAQLSDILDLYWFCQMERPCFAPIKTCNVVVCILITVLGKVQEKAMFSTESTQHFLIVQNQTCSVGFKTPRHLRGKGNVPDLTYLAMKACVGVKVHVHTFLT